jgi:hypothetical protein
LIDEGHPTVLEPDASCAIRSKRFATPLGEIIVSVGMLPVGAKS